MEDGKSVLWFWKWRDCGQSGAPRDMVNWDHVDSIIDVGHQSELNASLDKSPDEVVRVRNYKTPPSISRM